MSTQSKEIKSWVGEEPGLKNRLRNELSDYYSEPLTLKALKGYLMEIFTRPKGMSERKWKKHLRSLQSS